jgi:hypothetical protein
VSGWSSDNARFARLLEAHQSLTCCILGDPPAGTEHDPLAALLSASTALAPPVLGRVLAAAWRAALVAVAEGSDPQQARAALLALEFRLSS